MRGRRQAPPGISYTAHASGFSAPQSARCGDCGAHLVFETDGMGRLLERCARCGSSPAARPGAAVAQVAPPLPPAVPGQPCAHCGCVVPVPPPPAVGWVVPTLAAIAAVVPDRPGDGRRVFEVLVTLVDEHGDQGARGKRIAAALGLSNSTLASRLLRAGLPSVKELAQGLVFVRAAYLWDDPSVSLSRIADTLDFNSPQHLFRAFRRVRGTQPSVVRAQEGGREMLAWYLARYVLPCRTAFAAARVLAPVGTAHAPRLVA